MFAALKNDLQQTLDAIRRDGLYKDERVITTPQGTRVGVAKSLGDGVSGVDAEGLAGGVHNPLDGGAANEKVVILCANNYLGLGPTPGRHRGRPQGSRRLRLRHGQRPLHLRHAVDPQGAGGDH